MILVALGLLATAAWLWAGWYYASIYVGVDNLFYMLPAELGQFLVGFLAPLGIFWLLISQSATRRRLARVERALAELAPGEGTKRSRVSAPAPGPSGVPTASAPPAPGSGRAEPRLEPNRETRAAEAAGRKAEGAAPGAPKPPGNENAPRFASGDNDDEDAHDTDARRP